MAQAKQISCSDNLPSDLLLISSNFLRISVLLSFFISFSRELIFSTYVPEISLSNLEFFDLQKNRLFFET